MIIGVTGQMAAGKNLVCGILKRHGWLSVDADELVHRAIESCAERIKMEFSEEAEAEGINICADGNRVDRRALGEFLFRSPERLARQEAIVYPEITRMTEEFIAANPDADIILNAAVLYKIPLLLEKCSSVIFVTAPFLIRLFRAKKRDGIKISLIIRRFASQKNLLSIYRQSGKKIIILRNYGSADSLERKISKLF